MTLSYKKIIERGMNVAHTNICEQDKIWSRYSRDKVDIGETVARVIRTLIKALPLNLRLRALSLGSSDEPQFRILTTAFRGGVYLLDVNDCALNVVKERIKRQCTDHVITIKGDYTEIFLNSKNSQAFFEHKLENKAVHLVTLHHSLYYCEERNWLRIFANLYRHFLMQTAAVHAVLMASESTDSLSTTSLYNRFAGKFFGAYNEQDLRMFKRKLQREPFFKKAQILLKTNSVHFYVDDFVKFMSVVWMILLYPRVHQYSFSQRQEITEFIYKEVWSKKKPLIQQQDHLVIYKGISFRGLA